MSLPGLTRQSILFERLLRRGWIRGSSPRMTLCMVWLAHFTSLLPAGKRHRCPQIASREWEVQLSPSDKGEGGGTPKGAPNRAAACFPDCRKAEAHGNAFQRPAAATSSTLGPVLPGTGASKLAIQAGYPTLHRHPSSHLRQRPVVGTDGYPRPPGCAGHDPHARRRRIPPRATSVPATPL